MNVWTMFGGDLIPVSIREMRCGCGVGYANQLAVFRHRVVELLLIGITVIKLN